MALAAQALEAQKASKPLEQGGALEQVAARIKRVMGLTFEFTGLRGFSRRSGGMMGWAAISSQTWFSFRRASSCLSHRHAT